MANSVGLNGAFAPQVRMGGPTVLTSPDKGAMRFSTGADAAIEAERRGPEH